MSVYAKTCIQAQRKASMSTLRWKGSSWRILPICSGTWSCVWVCVWASACVCSCCCSWRLWLSTEIPLSLWSFSPSGDGDVWLAVAARLLAACLFCLQLFHLREAQDHIYERGKKKHKLNEFILIPLSAALTSHLVSFPVFTSDLGIFPNFNSFLLFVTYYFKFHWMALIDTLFDRY